MSPRELRDERRIAVQFVQGFHAADPRVASARGMIEEGPWDDERGRRMHRVVDGNDRLLQPILGALRGEIRLGAVVDRIAWERGRVRVRYRGGDGAAHTVRARGAVVSVPIGVLRSAPGAEGHIAFSPAIPGLRATVARIGFGSIVRVVVRLRERFWERDDVTPELAPRERETLTFLHADDDDIPVWWTTNPVRAPVLTGWAGGPVAARLSRRLPRDDRAHVRAARRQIVATLARQFGMRRSWIASRIEEVWTHDWGRDPFARGAYSYPMIGSEDALKAFRQPIAGTIAFAGEAWAPNGDNATMHGAIASGIHAAERLSVRSRRR